MSSASSFLMPDAEPAWQLWKSLHGSKVETLDTPSEVRENGRPLIVGLPATACRTLALTLPETTVDVLPAMVEAQLEKRGITVEKEPHPNFAWHLLGNQHGFSLVSVDILGHPFPEELAVRHAANYTAALRMLHLPPAELVVVEEQGLYVLAMGHQGKLWHSHILGSTEMSAEDLAREIHISQLALESSGTLTPLSSILLVGEKLARLQSALRPHLALPFKVTPRLEPAHNLKLDAAQKLLPTAVYTAQHNKQRRRLLVLVLLLLATVYAAAFAIGWVYLNGLRAKENFLEQDISQTAEPAAEVRATSDRWRAVEPAIDINRYPMVQLSQITSLMPPSGILIKKYTARPTEIEIEGDARDAQTVTQFLEDMKNHPKLSNFAWTMPVPSVRDKTASFKISGKLK